MRRTVPVTLPEEVWGRLASLADRRGVRVADLIAEAIEGMVPTAKLIGHRDGETGAPGRRLDVLAAEVTAAHRSGRVTQASVKKSLAGASR